MSHLLAALPSLTLTDALFPCLDGSAAVRVCADGGANRVFDGMPALLPGQDPDEVRARYHSSLLASLSVASHCVSLSQEYNCIRSYRVCLPPSIYLVIYDFPSTISARVCPRLRAQHILDVMH